jgi:hypothetical protein
MLCLRLRDSIQYVSPLLSFIMGQYHINMLQLQMVIIEVVTIITQTDKALHQTDLDLLQSLSSPVVFPFLSR